MLLRRQILGAANVVDVIRIAAIDQDVARLQIGDDSGDGFIHSRCGNHQPNGARLTELFDEVLQRGGAYSFLFDQFLDRLGEHIEDHAFVARLHQAPHHVGAHPS